MMSCWIISKLRWMLLFGFLIGVLEGGKYHWLDTCFIVQRFGRLESSKGFI